MIRHIVVWKLQAEDAAAKAEAVEAIRAVIEPLAAVIPGILSLTINANMAFFEANWDVALLGDYESLEALQAYQVHPDHVAAATIVRQYVAQRASIDVEL